MMQTTMTSTGIGKQTITLWVRLYHPVDGTAEVAQKVERLVRQVWPQATITTDVLLREPTDHVECYFESSGYESKYEARCLVNTIERAFGVR
jgi:hypothetical protein